MAIISELFESPKGTSVYGKRTICEAHRDIFDRLVAGLAERDPALLAEVVPLLEEAFLMGVHMNAKLIEHKDGNDEWSGPNVDAEESGKRRQRRAEILAENRALLARFGRRGPT